MPIETGQRVKVTKSTTLSSNRGRAAIDVVNGAMTDKVTTGDGMGRPGAIKLN